MPPIPRTQVRTGHSLTIRANGVTVGLINSWAPAQSRTITPIYEVGIDVSGIPVEYMPGNMTGLIISVQRYDTYPIRMEQAFGTPELAMLSRQSEPFSIIESWTIPGSDKKEQFVYDGCWFSSLGRTLRSDDNRIINVNASLVYTKKLKVTGITSGLFSGA